MPAHYLTLRHDLPIFNEFCKKISKNPHWAWLDKLVTNNILAMKNNIISTSLKDGLLPSPSMIVTDDGTNTIIIKYHTVSENKTLKTSKFSKFELYNTNTGGGANYLTIPCE